MMGKQEKALDTCKSGSSDLIQRCGNVGAGGDPGVHISIGGEEKDRFGCTMQVCQRRGCTWGSCGYATSTTSTSSECQWSCLALLVLV